MWSWLAGVADILCACMSGVWFQCSAWVGVHILLVLLVIYEWFNFGAFCCLLVPCLLSMFSKELCHLFCWSWYLCFSILENAVLQHGFKKPKPTLLKKFYEDLVEAVSGSASYTQVQLLKCHFKALNLSAPSTFVLFLNMYQNGCKDRILVSMP